MPTVIYSDQDAAWLLERALCAGVWDERLGTLLLQTIPFLQPQDCRQLNLALRGHGFEPGSVWAQALHALHDRVGR